jgi:uncharacterized protein YciI
MKLNKLMVLALLIGGIFATATAQSKPAVAPPPAYDAELAKKLGADEYGMKLYVFVILNRGAAKIEDKKVRDDLFAGHLKNIGRLAAERKLVLAGPFEGDQKMRGIFIFDVATVDEAKKLVETDPAIKAGLLEPEFYPWYGSAGLLEVDQIHKRIQKKGFLD